MANASLNTKQKPKSRSSGVKPVKDSKLVAAEQTQDIKKFLALFGIDHIRYVPHWYCNDVVTYQIGASNGFEYKASQIRFGKGTIGIPPTERALAVSQDAMDCLNFQLQQYVANITVVYVDDDWNVWAADLKIHIRGRIDCGYAFGNSRSYAQEIFIPPICTVTPFKVTEKLVRDAVALQTDEDLLDIIQAKNAYAYNFVWGNNYDPLNFLMAPQLEILHKANYVFAGKFLCERYAGLNRQFTPTEADCFNRLCRRGTSPATIFKTAKAVYKVLGPTEKDMSVWDTYRKLDKFGRITADSILEMHDRNMSTKNLDMINNILAQKYDGKPVFTWETLCNYLGRLDHYEAIECDEALMLLKDYLGMCHMLNMRPRTDGDSLKREHDVAARLCRYQRTTRYDQGIREAGQKLSKYNYFEGVYFIRAITSAEDLLDEATQMHSCLVSYGQSIANGMSNIFVMREVGQPNKSLITVELSQDRKDVRHALMAYNKPIRNKSQRDFMNRWLAFVRDVDKYHIA